MFTLIQKIIIGYALALIVLTGVGVIMYFVAENSGIEASTQSDDDRYAVFYKTDMTSNNITTADGSSSVTASDISSCQNYCDVTSGCVGYVFDQSTNLCYLKNAIDVTNIADKNDYFLGLKCTEVECKSDYVVFDNDTSKDVNQFSTSN